MYELDMFSNVYLIIDLNSNLKIYFYRDVINYIDRLISKNSIYSFVICL